MAPKVKITRESILEAALTIVREHGMDALNARAIAKHLGCSTQPIFSNYTDMNALHADILREVYTVYSDLLAKESESGRYPPYKASGMAYIRFAREEPQLFRAFFMRERSENEQAADDNLFFTSHVKDAVEGTGISGNAAASFHLNMWLFVHGIATLIATGYLSLSEEQASERISEIFHGIRENYLGGTHE